MPFQLKHGGLLDPGENYAGLKQTAFCGLFNYGGDDFIPRKQFFIVCLLINMTEWLDKRRITCQFFSFFADFFLVKAYSIKIK